MPWREVSVVEQRWEFVRLALQDGANRRELCRRFGVHPSTAYKWIQRHQTGSELADLPRRPHSSPRQTAAELEAQILAVRDAHPAWGARKIAACLERSGVSPPAASTIHQILRRSSRITPALGGPPADQRFEMAAPNLIWQMDFKGWVRLGNEVRCHPLTVIDDHSRYDLCLQACADQRGNTVKDRLESTFRVYGLPDTIFVDNGSPWSDSSGAPWTQFSVWLLKLGVLVIRSRPYHPQSRGKNERFHRTLDAEVLALRSFRSLAEIQHAFDIWREIYNFERPHEGIGNKVPADRYRPSARPMPDSLPSPEYDSGEIVRTVSSTKSYVHFKGQKWKVPQAFAGERLAIRPLSVDGKYGVFFAAHQVAEIDLTSGKTVGHVSEQASAMSPG